METNEIVKFNVGGKKFMTTLSTLTVHGENFLSKLATTEMGVVKDEKGDV